jgi:hypothetical protein
VAETLSSDTVGYTFIDQGSGGFSVEMSGTGYVKLVGIPTSNPHVLNAVYSNLGVLTLSAG